MYAAEAHGKTEMRMLVPPKGTRRSVVGVALDRPEALTGEGGGCAVILLPAQ